MPRKSRKKSESGIYHIILRGINRQQIFEEAEDRSKFLEILDNYQKQCGYTLYAYCLMGNHIHLLIKEGSEELSIIFKRIAGSFVYWYNWKYHRCWHLFQDRFKSEPVEDDAYFLTVLRYIHQNPVRAKLCERTEDYTYRSMLEYLTNPVRIDTEFARSLISREEFIRYHKELNSDDCLEINNDFRLTDEEAKAIIFKVSKCKTASEFLLLDKKRNNYLNKLHEKGLSIRQITRLTGVSKRIVEYNI